MEEGGDGVLQWSSRQVGVKRVGQSGVDWGSLLNGVLVFFWRVGWGC